jgi:hypothetical protein
MKSGVHTAPVALCRQHMSRPYAPDEITWFTTPRSDKQYIVVGNPPICSHIGCMEEAKARQVTKTGILPRCEQHIIHPHKKTDIRWYKRTREVNKITSERALEMTLSSLSKKEVQVYDMIADKKVVLMVKTIAGAVGRLVQKGLVVIVRDYRLPKATGQKVVVLKSHYDELEKR